MSSLYLVYLFIAKFALVYIHTVTASIAAIRATKALRLDFLQSLLRQDMSYFDSKDAGSPSVKVTTNGNLVTNGISEKLAVFVQSCATFVAAFVVAFAVQWKLTLITVCVVPTIVIVTGVCMGIEVKSEDKLMGIYSRASLVAEEVFSSISTVHAFWLQPVMAKRYEEYLAEMERVGMKKSPNYGVLFSTEFFCVYAGYGLAFWQGIRMYARGEVHEPGDIVTCVCCLAGWMALLILWQCHLRCSRCRHSSDSSRASNHHYHQSGCCCGRALPRHRQEVCYRLPLNRGIDT
jgi:ATP-binding cassette subfamily B (MDR/TAP) protein 1